MNTHINYNYHNKLNVSVNKDIIFKVNNDILKEVITYRMLNKWQLDVIEHTNFKEESGNFNI